MALLHAVVLELGDVAVVARVDLLVHTFQHLLPFDGVYCGLLYDTFHAGRRVEYRLGEINIASWKLVPHDKMDVEEEKQLDQP